MGTVLASFLLSSALSPREAARSPLQFFDRAPKHNVSRKDVSGLSDSVKLEVAAASSLSAHLWKVAILSAWCLCTSYGLRGGSRDTILQPQMTDNCLQEKQKTSIIYRPALPSRTWLHVEREKRGTHTHTGSCPQGRQCQSQACAPFFISLPIFSSYWVPERKGTTLKDN